MSIMKYGSAMSLIIILMVILGCESIHEKFSTKNQPTSTFKPVSEMTIDERINKLIEEHPEYVEPYFGRRCMDTEAYAFQQILRDGSLNESIKYLESDLHYLRQAVRFRIQEAQGGRGNSQEEDWKPVLQKAYDEGSARIKFELYNDLYPKEEIGKRWEFLNQIIKDDNLQVFYGDLFSGYGGINLKEGEGSVDLIGYCKKMMKSKHEYERTAGFDQLVKLESTYSSSESKLQVSALVPILIEFLENGQFDESKKGRIIARLGDLGDAAADAIPLLEKFLDDSSYAIQTRTIASLYLIGHNKEQMFDDLRDRLKNCDTPEKLKTTIDNFARLGVNAKPVLSDFMELMSHENGLVRNAARYAINKIDSSFETSNAVLFKNMNHENPEIVIHSMKILADPRRLKPFEGENNNAKTHRVKITKLLKNKLEDKNLVIVFEACKLLVDSDIDKKLIARALVKVSEDDLTIEKKREIVDIFEKLGQDAEPARDILVNLMDLSRKYDAQKALNVAISLGADMEPIVSKLMYHLEYDDHAVRESSIELLGQLGGKAVSALPVLIRVGETEEYSEYFKASQSISKILSLLDSDSPVELKTLYDAMAFDHANEFNNAIKAIKLRGGNDNDIAEKLGSLLNHKIEGVRTRILYKLEKMDNATLALPYLTDFIKSNPRDYEKKIAIRCVKKIAEKMGDEASKNQEILVGLMDLDEYQITKNVCVSISEKDGNFDLVVRKLIEQVQSDDLESAKRAFDGLMAMAGKAHSALPVLNKMLDDESIPDDYKRETHGNMTTVHSNTLSKKSLDGAIKKILDNTDLNSPVSIDELIKYADTDDIWRSRSAIEAITRKIDNTDESIKKLIGFCKHHNNVLASRAMDRITRFGVDALPYLDELKKLPEKYPTGKKEGSY